MRISCSHRKKIYSAAEDTAFHSMTPLDLEDDVDDKSDDDFKDNEESDEHFRSDDPTIEIDNNIAGHYIAECERCHGVFISSIIGSDQEIESVSGICPLCDHESTQWLNWIIVNAKDSRYDVRRRV